MKKIVYLTVLLIISIAFASEFGSGLQQNARQQGIGEAFTGLADDGEAVFYNPAGLINIDKIEIVSMYSRQLAGVGNDGGINVSYLGYSQKIDDKIGTFGIRWFYRGFSDNNEVEVLNAKENYIMIGYGRTLTDIPGFKTNKFIQKSSIGLTLNLSSWGFYGNDGLKYYTGKSDYSSFDMSLDLAYYHQMADKISLGLNLKNLISIRTKEDDKDYSIPIGFRLGGAWKYEDNNRDVFLFDISKEMNRYTANIGSERYFDFKYKNETDLIIARGGLQIGFDDYSSLALGFGYQATNIAQKFQIDTTAPIDLRFDYAIKFPLSMENSAINHTMQLSFLINRDSKKEIIREKTEVVPVEVEKVKTEEPIKVEAAPVETEKVKTEENKSDESGKIDKNDE